MLTFMKNLIWGNRKRYLCCTVLQLYFSTHGKIHLAALSKSEWKTKSTEIILQKLNISFTFQIYIYYKTKGHNKLLISKALPNFNYILAANIQNDKEVKMNTVINTVLKSIKHNTVYPSLFIMHHRKWSRKNAMRCQILYLFITKINLRRNVCKDEAMHLILS